MARAASSSATAARRSTEQAVIGRTTRVRGRVSGDGDLRVEGAIAGDVSLGGNLTVDADAEIHAAEVQASSVAIEGTVEAEVVASETVSIGEKARVSGVIRGGGISIDEGARVAVRLEADFELPPELSGKAGR